MPTLARPTGPALALIAALVASSCTAIRANGPSLSSVREDLDRVALVPAVESLDAEPPRPTATGPLRIAILPPITVEPRGYGIPPQAFDSWNADELTALEAWGDSARAEGLIADVRFVPSFMVDTTDGDLFASARRAGLSLGADAVLLTRLGTTFEVSATAMSLLDLVIVPAFVLPSAEFTSTAIVEGALIDVRSGYVYAVGTAEHELETMAPSLTGDAADYRKAARFVGVEEMVERLAVGTSVMKR